MYFQSSMTSLSLSLFLMNLFVRFWNLASVYKCSCIQIPDVLSYKLNTCQSHLYFWTESVGWYRILKISFLLYTFFKWMKLFNSCYKSNYLTLPFIFWCLNKPGLWNKVNFLKCILPTCEYEGYFYILLNIIFINYLDWILTESERASSESPPP